MISLINIHDAVDQLCFIVMLRVLQSMNLRADR